MSILSCFLSSSKLKQVSHPNSSILPLLSYFGSFVNGIQQIYHLKFHVLVWCREFMQACI
jgi:hypothetical protein